MCNDVGAIVLGQWYHIVAQRSGSVLQIYRDGVLKNSAANDTVGGGTSSFVIGNGNQGSASDAYKFIGYLDQFRISSGIARYGKYQLPTAQQVITSSNSDSGVITSNSTFGTGDNVFTTDSYTAILVTGDENFGGTATATISIGGSGPGPVSSGTLTLTNNSTATQRRGFSAFGANSYFIDGTDTDEGLYVQMSNNTALANLHSFTVEGWYKSTFVANKFLWTAQYDSTDAWDYDMIGSYQESAILLRTNWDVSGTSGNYVNVSTSAHADDEWHHFAWQYDFTSKPYPTVTTLIDGQIKDVSSSSVMTTGNKDYKNGKFWIGNGGDIVRAMTGYVDSWRFSANILRYGYSGTNTKLGINTVHHSNCKLLINSNTFSGNTHFDDFSDQGNYWNQTPYNYYFSRAPYLKNVNAGNMARSIMDGDRAGSIAAWVMLRPGATLSQKTIISFTDTGATDQYFQFDVNEQVSGKHILGIGEVYNGSAQSNILGTSVPIEEGVWYLAGCVSTGTAYKLYLNGIDIGGTTSGTQGDWIFDCNGDGGLDNVNVGELMRSSGGGEWDGRIAQVAVWGNTSDTAQGGAGVLSTAQFQAMYEAGPTANWTTDYQTNMRLYYAMGNHNSLAGRGVDTGDICHDRSGNAIDLTIGDGNAILSPHKGNLIKPYGTVKHSTDLKNFGSSAIFFDGNSDYLEMQPDAMGTASTTCDFTFEAWVSFLGHDGNAPATIVTSTKTDNSNEWYIRLDGSDYLNFHSDSLSADLATSTVAYDRIVDGKNSWHHVVGQRKNTKCELYLDGLLVAHSGTTGTGFTAGGDRDMVIGRREWLGSNVGQYWLGYMDGIAYYHGIAKYNPVVTGLGTATVTPSSYLPDPTGNHFINNTGLAVTDQMLDTPENNFNTFNPLSDRTSYSGTGYLKESNLSIDGSPHTTSWGAKVGTHLLTSGKWYYEMDASTWVNGGGGGHNIYAGFYDIAISGEPNGQNLQNPQNAAGGYSITFNNTEVNIINSGTAGTVDTSQLSSPIVGLLIDIDNATFEARLNGITFKAVQNITVAAKPEIIAFAGQSDGGTIAINFNFGQGDPDGQNNFTDSNGRGGFRHEPPEGFLSLCTANMEDEDYAPIGPNTIAGTPDKHFDTVLYSGMGLTASNDPNVSSRRIGGLNFQPDMILIKNRHTTDGWSLQDSVRGWEYGTKLSPYDSSNENKSDGGSYGNYGFVSGAFDGGFEICPGTSPGHVDKDTSNNFVAFSWKAGNGTTVNDDGTHPTTVSVNKDAGFSIITYTGDVSGTAVQETIGHGLDKTPEFVIVKDLTNATNWRVYHKGLAASGATATANTLYLNTNGAQTGVAARIADVNATTITLGGGTDDGGGVIGNDRRHVAYAWHGVEGFSKFGSYKANDNADGPFIYCGFKPAMVIIKNISNAQYWHMQDNKRSPFNPCDNAIFPNATNVEADNGDIDFLSNGFKIRTTENTTNQSTDTFVYMVWAEMPFKYARAR